MHELFALYHIECCTSNALFTVTGSDLLISAMATVPRNLTWNSWSGDIYRVQSCTNLMLTNWVDGVSVTSVVDGVLTVTNAFPVVDPVQFMRVLRLWP